MASLDSPVDGVRLARRRQCRDQLVSWLHAFGESRMVLIKHWLLFVLEPAVEVQQRFMQQPPSPSPKPVSPTFKPLTPDPVQNYKPFVPTPIYQPPQQQQPQMPIYQPPQQQQPQMPIYQPPQQQQPQMPIYQPTQQQQPQFSPQPVQQQYVPPPVQTHFAPLPVYTPQPAASRALSVAPQEMVNTVYRAAPPNVDRLFNTANADLQRDAEVPNYQPAPQTLVRRYSQQFDNYNPQYSNQQPQSGFQPGYQQQPQSQNYQNFSGQQQNYYKQPQAQQSRHVSWNPELKQTQHYAPQSTNEFRRYLSYMLRSMNNLNVVHYPVSGR
jgi:hypothetical protein